MGLTLYHGEPNGPSLTVLAALAETGVPADLVRIDLAAGERHTGPVPRGVEVEMSIEGEGPVLVADGAAMADSVFIGLYLDAIGTGTPLQPADPYGRWQVQAWCRFIVERVAPAAALLGCWAFLTRRLQAMDEGAFAALMGAIKSPDLAERWRAARAGIYPEEQLADSRAKIVQGVARLEAQLGDAWVLGAFSIADLETYGWLAGMVEVVPEAFAEAERTRAWLGRVKARPAVRRALAAAQSNDPRREWAIGPEINRWG